MMLIDRYVLKLFWLYFLGTLLVFVTIFIAIDAMSTMVKFQGVLPSSLMQYYLYSLPEVIGTMLPVASLAGLMLTVSGLNKNNELVALFSSGMSLLRISLPIMISVLFVSVVGFFAADRLVPVLSRNKNYVYYYEIEKKPSKFSTVKTNRICI